MTITKIQQGRAIVEPDGDGGLLVMLPNGDIHHAADAATALGRIRRYAARHLKAQRADVGLLTVEWRDGAQEIIETERNGQ